MKRNAIEEDYEDDLESFRENIKEKPIDENLLKI